MHAEDLIPWIRLTVAVVIFGATCFGFGWMAECIVRRNEWRSWVLGLLVFFSSLLWPVTVVVYTIYDARRYLLQHPHDDAPGMVVVSVIYVVAPFLFVVGLLPIFAGIAFARRKSVLRVKETA
jgi:hypothetical protein